MNLKKDDLEKLKRGAKVNYVDKLSALPNNSGGEENSELPLLMFDFQLKPEMWD